MQEVAGIELNDVTYWSENSGLYFAPEVANLALLSPLVNTLRFATEANRHDYELALFMADESSDDEEIVIPTAIEE